MTSNSGLPPAPFPPLPAGEASRPARPLRICIASFDFVGPVRNGMLEQLGVKLDQRGNVAVGEDWMSSVPGVFAAGDMRRGQSLVVWAISEGRKAARAVDMYLMGESRLP